jgi:hypothetical protein
MRRKLPPRSLTIQTRKLQGTCTAWKGMAKDVIVGVVIGWDRSVKQLSLWYTKGEEYNFNEHLEGNWGWTEDFRKSSMIEIILIRLSKVRPCRFKWPCRNLADFLAIKRLE